MNISSPVFSNSFRSPAPKKPAPLFSGIYPIQLTDNRPDEPGWYGGRKNSTSAGAFDRVLGSLESLCSRALGKPTQIIVVPKAAEAEGADLAKIKQDLQQLYAQRKPLPNPFQSSLYLYVNDEHGQDASFINNHPKYRYLEVRDPVEKAIGGVDILQDPDKNPAQTEPIKVTLNRYEIVTSGLNRRPVACDLDCTLDFPNPSKAFRYISKLEPGKDEDSFEEIPKGTI